MEKYDVSLIFNVILIILEVIALVICFDALGCIDLRYYTIDSNIFLLISYNFSGGYPCASVKLFSLKMPLF